VNNPKVLLLDEPLGALDMKLRKQMQIELKHLQQQLGITFIFVTHDQEEALTMSDRICVMNNGLIEQIGTPDEIYEKPKTKFVADFIGETNIFDVCVNEIKTESENVYCITFEDNQKTYVKHTNLNEGETVTFAIRPERLVLTDSPKEDEPSIKVTFKERIYIGSITKTIVKLSNGRDVLITEPAGTLFNFSKDKTAYLSWDSQNTVVIK
jgi:spermidine/putrescine transport system ATP-binding protein